MSNPVNKVIISKDVIGIIGDNVFRVSAINLETKIATLTNVKHGNIINLSIVPSSKEKVDLKDIILVPDDSPLVVGSVITFNEDGESTSIEESPAPVAETAPTKKTPPLNPRNPA